MPLNTTTRDKSGGGFPSCCVAGHRSGCGPCPWFVKHRRYVPTGGFHVLLRAGGKRYVPFSGSQHQKRLPERCPPLLTAPRIRGLAGASPCWSRASGSRGLPSPGASRGVWGRFYVGFWPLPRLGRLQAAAFSFAGAFARFRSLFIRNFTSPIDDFVLFSFFSF